MYTRENLKEHLSKKSYKNADLANSKVLIRSCLNVKLSKDGQSIKDRTRLDEAYGLIKELQDLSKRVVVMAHLGRPEGRDPSLSFKVVQEAMQEDLGETVHLVEDIEEINQIAEDYQKDKRIFLIENIRFFSGEKSKDDSQRLELAKQLAGVADIFVNDAFPDYLKPKKKTASCYEIATLLPSFVGPAFAKEVDGFVTLANPKRPLVAVMGGAKLEDKTEALASLIKFADKVVVGGAMAYTLMRAKGITTGNSLIDEASMDLAKQLVEEGADKLVLPIDHLAVEKFEEPESDSGYANINEQNIPDGMIAVDIGPKTIELFTKHLQDAQSILWNGPMGVFEWDKAGYGTQVIAEEIAKSNAYSLAGGGDSIAAINKYGISGFDHISNGGGAMLAYIAYDEFATLDVIFDN
jgi:phosphoglycerate kinase